MLYRNTDHWTDKNLYSGLLFFAQRLDELSFEYTIDSYKAPTTNVAFLARECLTRFEECEKLEVSYNSSFHILDELENRLSENLIVRSLLSLNLENYLKIDRKNISEIIKRLSILRREIDPHAYFLKITELTPPLIKTNRKKDLNFLARELVTTLVGLKVNLSYINKTVRDTFFSNRPVNDETDLEHFFRIVFPHRHKFKVALKVSGSLKDIHEDIFNGFKFELLDSITDFFSKDIKKQEFKKIKKEQHFVVQKEVFATDANEAIQISSKNLSRLFNLYRLFNHKAVYELWDSGMAEQVCCSKGMSLVPTHVNRMQHILDNRPNAASHKLSALIKNRKLPTGKDKESFFRVIDFHGMSLDSNIVENQLLNLWTCFETIVPQKNQGTTISNVVRSVHPFIGIQYFRRLFVCISFDLLRWNRRILTDFLKVFKFPSEFDLIDKVFYFITSEHTDKNIKDLYTKLGDFELLRFRIFQLRENFKSPNTAIETLDRHQQRFDWQMYRIYRTRNAIIHSGSTPHFSGLLVENAHDYFDQVFDLTSSLSRGYNALMNFSECFNFVELRYAQYRRDLKKMNEFSMSDVKSVLWVPNDGSNKSQLFRDA